jgi:hypothetical protein
MPKQKEIKQVRKELAWQMCLTLSGTAYLMPLLTKVFELAFEGQRFGI